MKEKKKDIPKFEVTEAPNFRGVYASGVFGGLDPNEGRMIFYVDRFKPKPREDAPGQMDLDKIVHELQVEVHVSPSQFKAIAEWMMSRIQDLERITGKLPDAKEGKRPPGIA